MGKLYPFVLLIVLTGMIIGVGVLTLDKFAAVTFYAVNNVNDTITQGANNTFTTLSWGNITNVDQVYNDTSNTNVLPSYCYSINTTHGQFQIANKNNASCLFAGRSFYVVYDAKNFATATRDATASASTEISNISSSWIGLIVTVLILSIILFMVIRSFNPNMSR